MMPSRRRLLRFWEEVPRIDPGRCMALNGSFCSVCVERCPRPGAIHLSAGQPQIDPERCDGCGRCQELCPAPANAIDIPAGWGTGRSASASSEPTHPW